MITLAFPPHNLASRFFAICSLHSMERDRLINKLIDVYPLTVETLLNGNVNLSFDEN